MKVNVYGCFDCSVIANSPLITVYELEGHYYFHTIQKGHITGFKEFDIRQYNKRNKITPLEEKLEKSVGETPYIFFKKGSELTHFSLENTPDFAKAKLSPLYD